MQIHELNDYSGELNSSAFVAIDDGNDTGKKSIAAILADVNARINNIIAGGTAPSEAEIIDARYGGDGVDYSSLGAAIRGQYTSLKGDINDIVLGAAGLINAVKTWISGGYISASSGLMIENSSFSYTEYMMIDGGAEYVVETNGQFNGAWYDNNKTFISGINIALPGQNTVVITAPQNAVYMRGSASTSVISDIKVTKNVLPVLNEKISIDPENIEGLNIFMNSYELIEPKNLFDPSTVTVGKYYNSSGAIINSGAQNVGISDFIPVEKNRDVTATNAIDISLFDSSKTWLGNTTTATFNTGNASYAVVNLNPVAHKDDLQLEYGSAATSFEPYFSAYYKLNNSKVISDFLPYDLIVAGDGTGDYTSLTEAVEKCNSGDRIYVKNGVYENEIVRAWGKEVHIVGEDKFNTIIKNSYSTYSKPPIEFCDGSLENLTFYAENDGTPSSDSSGWNAYAMHIENTNMVGKKPYVKNCIFESDLNPAVGAGLRKNSVLTFENCDFITHNASRQALFFHDAYTPTDIGDQKISIRNCRMLNDASGAISSVRIDSEVQSGADVTVEMAFNVCYPNAAKIQNVQNDVGTEVSSVSELTNFNVSHLSYGNSLSSLEQ